MVGNRLHLAFKRQVHQEEAEDYAEKNSMGFFEVSPLVNFNISETLVELARMALRRNGMERWNGRSNKGNSIKSWLHRAEHPKDPLPLMFKYTPLMSMSK